MRETHVRVLIHLVWATWDRLPIITDEVKEVIFRSIQATCTNSGTSVLAIGGVEDHVHLLIALPATVALASLVKQIKGISSHLVTHELLSAAFFKWQGVLRSLSVHMIWKLLLNTFSVKRNIMLSRRFVMSGSWSQRRKMCQNPSPRRRTLWSRRDL